MSYSLNRSINRSRRIDSEASNSPRNDINVPPKQTVFEFFRKKSRRDLDRSFSSAKQSRRHKETVSPQVQLLKDLNTSPSPTKQPQKSRLSPNKKTTTFSPSKTIQHPLKVSDLKFNSTRDDFSFLSENNRTNAETPLFIKLIKAGHNNANATISFNNNKDKPRVPIAPTNVKRRLSSSLNPHNYSHVQERANPFDDERSLEEMINQGHRHSFRETNNSTIHYSPLRNSIARNGSPSQRSHRSQKSHRSQRDQISPLRESRSPPRRTQATPRKSVGSPMLSKRIASPLRASISSPAGARKQTSPLRKSISSPMRDVVNTTQEIKFFKTLKGGMSNGTSLTGCIQEYEHKYDELSDLLQRQVLQNNRIFQLLSDGRYSRDYGLNEIRTLVEDLGLTLVAASRFVNEGLFDTKECLALFAKAEQRHKQEIQELTDALDQTRSAVKTEKNEHHEKLEDLLTYIENLKRAPKVDSEDEARRRQKERAIIEKREVEIAKLKEHVRQLTQENKHYENQVRNLAQENQDLGVQNAYLKESQEVLRKEAEVLRNHFEENSRAQVQVRKERRESRERKPSKERKESREGREKRVGGIREVLEGRKSSSKGRQVSPLKSMRSPSMRSASPTKRLAGLEEGNGQLKKELDLMSHRMEILAKENEDLARKLTDKILIERENKALMYKTQELADGLKSKSREYDNLMRAVKDTKDKLVNTGGHTILSSTLKHYGLEDRPLGKLNHW